MDSMLEALDFWKLPNMKGRYDHCGVILQGSLPIFNPVVAVRCPAHHNDRLATVRWWKAKCR